MYLKTEKTLQFETRNSRRAWQERSTSPSSTVSTVSTRVLYHISISFLCLVFRISKQQESQVPSGSKRFPEMSNDKFQRSKRHLFVRKAAPARLHRGGAGKSDIFSKIVFSRQVATYVTRDPRRKAGRAAGIYRV